MVGFVFIGILTLLVIAAGVLIESVNRYEIAQAVTGYVPGTFSWGWAIGYILFLLIYTLPIHYLYRFSRNTQRALQEQDGPYLQKAAAALYRHFAFIGILFTVGFLIFKIGALLLLILPVVK